MGGGLEGCCVGGACGADGAVRLVLSSWWVMRVNDKFKQGIWVSFFTVLKTICCNSTSNAPDDGRMYPKHVELRIRQ